MTTPPNPKPTNTNADVMTTAEAALYMRISSETLLGMARAGEIPGINYGNSWTFSRAQLLDYQQHRALAEQLVRKNRAPEEQPTAARKAGRPRRSNKVLLEQFQSH